MWTNLRVSNKGNADGKLPPHSSGEGLRSGVPLVFQVENVDDALNLVWDLFARETLQLEDAEKNELNDRIDS